MKSAYGDIKLQSKIEINKRSSAMLVEVEPIDDTKPLKIDAINDDENQMKLKVRINVMRRNAHIYAPGEIDKI